MMTVARIEKRMFLFIKSGERIEKVIYTEKSGGKIPRAESPDKSEKIPSPTTTIPAVLKKSGANFDCENERDEKERSPKTGKVPSAKKNKMLKPPKKDPEESA